MEKLARWLMESDMVSSAELKQVMALQQEKGIPLAMALIDLKMVRETDLVNLIAEHYQLPKAPKKLHKLTIPMKVLGIIPQDLCWQGGIFPFGVDMATRQLQIAILDPADPEAKSILNNLPNGLTAELYIAGPRQLEKGIQKHYFDSIVEETGKPRLRFFGYDNITAPGVSRNEVESSPAKNFVSDEDIDQSMETDLAAYDAAEEDMPGLEFEPAEPTRNKVAREESARSSSPNNANGSEPIRRTRSTVARISREDQRVVDLIARVDALERAVLNLASIVHNQSKGMSQESEKVLEYLQRFTNWKAPSS